jgi:hypothetical protein
VVQLAQDRAWVPPGINRPSKFLEDSKVESVAKAWDLVHADQ